ncbi:MAG: ABC transporter substrate-binding protein [Burkholderiaceae bacterium]
MRKTLPWLISLTACSLFTPSQAQPLAELAAVAAKKAPVVWYESSPSEQADKVIAAFSKRYPDVKVRHTRLIGGNDLVARAVQEMQARGYTGDVLTDGADRLFQVHSRGYMEDVNWGSLRVPKSLTPTSYMMATAAAVYVVAWNTRKVSDAEAPSTWEQLLDPKWANRMGSWVRAGAFAQLAATQGPDTARRQLERFIALKPMLFKSTFPLAQAVGAGEVDLGIGLYHATLPPMNAGAPIRMRALDVVPMHIIYSGVTRNARNPEGARLLLSWLGSEEGAIAYENATGRGSPFVAQTKTAQFIRGKTLSEWPPEQSAELAALNEYYNKLMESVGAAR